MISHDRPMAEVLAGRAKDIGTEYERGFVGMTDEQVTQAELEAAHAALVADIVGKMPEPHKRLLVSVERGEPDWSLLGIDGAADLPAVKWRLKNIGTLDEARRSTNGEALSDVLGLSPATETGEDA